MTTIRAEFILYVEDQQRSTAFYAAVLDLAPTLEVVGMTEFTLPGGSLLGLMPRASIHRLLPQLMDESRTPNAAGAELYLVVDQIDPYYQRSLEAGARPLSEAADRDWGDRVSYVLDPDGYVLAFASPLS